MMLKSVFLVGTTAFWLAMATQLIQREFFQLTPIQSAYQVLPIYGFTVREEYQGIYLGDRLIGFNLAVLEKKEDAGEDAKEEGVPAGMEYELRQNTYMTFLFLGEEREMLVKSKALLDERLELQSFELKFTSGENWTEMTGQIAKDNLNLVIESKEGEPIRKIIPVQRPLFFSESLNMIWTPENLKTGKQGKVHMWNPLLMNFEDLDFRVGPKLKISHDGKETEAYDLRLMQKGIETRYWVSPEGVVLKHESPTGLLMVKQDAWKIFDKMRQERGKLTDLPNLYSVASNVTFENPGELRRLKVRVKSPEADKLLTLEKPSLDAYRQVPLPVPHDVLLKIPSGLAAPYLAATEFIQSEDPFIAKQARDAAGSEKSALDASLKIMSWVNRWVAPSPSVNIPSAVQVFKVRKGDCNEYTALFTAMTRALGIPTKMVAGLVYQNGRFFYHAWPEVFLGRWIGMDPTFDQAPNDVTHIPLVEGDLEEQIDLIRKVGQVQITVLESE